MFFLNPANHTTYFCDIESDINPGYISININPIPFGERGQRKGALGTNGLILITSKQNVMSFPPLLPENRAEEKVIKAIKFI